MWFYFAIILFLVVALVIDIYKFLQTEEPVRVFWMIFECVMIAYFYTKGK